LVSIAKRSTSGPTSILSSHCSFLAFQNYIRTLILTQGFSGFFIGMTLSVNYAKILTGVFSFMHCSIRSCASSLGICLSMTNT
jgi:hypothetical protein